VYENRPAPRSARFFGVDRSLSRIAVSQQSGPHFVQTLDEVPSDGPTLLIANELFDAFPFARLVQRDEHLHELWVTDREGQLDWCEKEASAEYEDYFASRGIELADGQFADVSLEWSAYYADLCRFADRALIVTLDYGFPQEQLFHPRFRRFGTAASYSQQRVTRDLLNNPGEQDLTAHINFTDLISTGERAGFTTLFFDRQAKFLLSLGITDHPLFAPIEEVASAEEGLRTREAREDARRLVLPDGIGEEIRVLVQSRGLTTEGWSFQRKLY
jgi:SAM-dependent MidA family methyltransferase